MKQRRLISIDQRRGHLKFGNNLKKNFFFYYNSFDITENQTESVINTFRNLEILYKVTTPFFENVGNTSDKELVPKKTRSVNVFAGAVA